MYKINIICVGNLKDKEYIEMCNEYAKRISRFAKVNIIELKEQNQYCDISKIIEIESQEIENHIAISQTILMDRQGEQYSSEEFAKFLEYWFMKNSELNFVIGGSYGVSDNLKKIVKTKMSMSKMTFPHRLFRVMLLEQIYRTFTILNNVSYHK